MRFKLASSVSCSHRCWAVALLSAGATGALLLPGVAQLAIVPVDDDARPAKKAAPAAPLADDAIFGAPARSEKRDEAHGIGDADTPTMAPGALTLPAMEDVKTAASRQAPRVTIEFRDVPVVELLQMITQQGEVDIMIGTDVEPELQIRYIKLTNVTPQDAIQRVARSAGLKWKKMDTRTYFVGRQYPIEDEPNRGDQNPGMGIPQSIVPNDNGFYDDAPNVRRLPDDRALPALGAPNFNPSQLFQLEEMRGRDKDDGDERDIKPIRVRYVRAGIIAYWLNPSRQPMPWEFEATQRNMQKANSHYRLMPGVDPAVTQQIRGNAPTVPFMSNYNPYINPYVNPYINPQAIRAQPTYRTNYAFGGGGGGFGGGGFGGGTQGNTGQTGQGLSGGGVLELPEGIDQLVAIDAQNVLLVYGTAEAVARLQTIIEFLDRPIRQVEIEAQFVDVSVSEAKGFGIEFFNRGSEPTGDDDDDDGGSIPGIGAGVPGANVLTITRGAFQARLNFLTSTGRARIINSPRVTTMNNLAASLQSSQQTPIVLTQTTEGIGGQVGTEQNAFFLETTIGIDVAPTINNDDTVTVFLRPRVETQVPTPGLVLGGGGDDDDDDDDGGGSSSSIPTVLQQELTTIANVKDNDVIVLGGLRTRTESIVRSRIPILSRLPIIGRLFRSSNRTDVDRELVIFMTARVQRRSTDVTPITGP